MDEPEVPDEELVRRLRQGDTVAAWALHDRYADRLKAMGRRRIRGKVRRKVGESDVVQEAYLAAFEGIEGFQDQGPGSFRRWLDRILEHKAADLLRHHVGADRRSTDREDSLSPGVPAPDRAATDPTPSSVAARREDLRALRRAIDATSGDDRLILELVHEKGLDFREAGRLMGRSAEAARKLYGRVVLRLERRLRSTEGGQDGSGGG